MNCNFAEENTVICACGYTCKCIKHDNHCEFCKGNFCDTINCLVKFISQFEAENYTNDSIFGILSMQEYN